MLVKSFESNNYSDFNPEDTNGNQITLRSKVTLFKDDNKVSLVASNYFTGRNHYSRKRWYRWQTERATGFYRNKNGTICPYDYVKEGKRKMRNVPPNYAFSIYEQKPYNVKGTELFAYFVDEVFGDVSLKSLYPISDLYNINTYENIPHAFTRDFREQEFRNFVESAFGKKHMRKDLVKAAAKANPHVLMYAQNFKGKVPTDWIVDYLRKWEDEPAPYNRLNRYPNRKIRDTLSWADDRTLRNLLRSDENPVTAFNFINDTFPTDPGRMQFVHLENMRGNTYRSWREIHDAVYVRPVVRGNIYTPPKPVDAVIEFTDLAKALDGVVVNGMKIQAAAHTKQMQQWSEEMHNCISSYVRTAIDGNGVYLGVYEDKKLLANIEIDRENNLKQMLGKYNAVLDTEVIEALESVLKEEGVTIPDYYWGQPADRQPPVQPANILNNDGFLGQNVVVNANAIRADRIVVNGAANNIQFHHNDNVVHRNPIPGFVDFDADW